MSKDSEALLNRQIALFSSVNQTLPPLSTLTVHDICNEDIFVNDCSRAGHSGILYSLNLFSAGLYLPSRPLFADTYHTWPSSTAIPSRSEERRVGKEDRSRNVT